MSAALRRQPRAGLLRREHVPPRRDASKVALVHLVARLIAGGFELLDTQYVTEHLRSFGAVEVPRRRYRTLLDKAIAGEPADFMRVQASISGEEALEIIAKR